MYVRQGVRSAVSLMRKDETDQFCHGLLSFGLSLHVDTEGRQVARKVWIQLGVLADVTVDVCKTDKVFV